MKKSWYALGKKQVKDDAILFFIIKKKKQKNRISMFSM